MKLALLIITFNETKNLSEFLLSLSNQTDQNFDIYVIDNSPNDVTKEFISNQYKQVNYYKNEHNLGFAKAANKGFNLLFKLKYTHVMVLNSDLVADKLLIYELRKTIQKFSKQFLVGMVQPLLLIHGSKIINSAGNPIHFLGFGFAGNFKNNISSVPKFDHVVTSCPGGASIISKELYDKVGAFDESFEMYCEDQDLCWRGHMHGFKFILSYKARLYHKYHFARWERKLFYYERNRILMLIKNYSLKTLLLLLPILIINELMMLVYSLLSGWFVKKISSYYSIYSLLRSTLSKRRIVQFSRKFSDKLVLSKFTYQLDSNFYTSPILALLIRIISSIHYLYFRLIFIII